MILIVFSTEHNLVMSTGVAFFSMLECALDTDFLKLGSNLMEEKKKVSIL